jgi:hypothetical protein
MLTGMDKLELVTLGNDEAKSFLLLWRAYVHGIDDIVDGDVKDGEGIIRVFLLAAELYSHPFYLRHLASLKQVVVNCTNAFADCVPWEKHGEAWQQQWADHYRHFGSEMVLAVAYLCGGYDNMRRISPQLRAICWHEHHDKDGKPI